MPGPPRLDDWGREFRPVNHMVLRERADRGGAGSSNNPRADTGNFGLAQQR